MLSSLLGGSGRGSGLPRGGVALGSFLVTGGVVALAEWGLLPRAGILVAAPAIVGTLLVDTWLYNTFLMRTGAGFWALLAGFLAIQAVCVEGGLRLLVRGWQRLTDRPTRASR